MHIGYRWPAQCWGEQQLLNRLCGDFELSWQTKNQALHVLYEEKYYRTPTGITYLEFSIMACFSNHQNHKNLFDLICLNYLSCWMPAAMNSCCSEEALLLYWIVSTPETIRPSFEIISFMSRKCRLKKLTVVFQCLWLINLQIEKEQKLLLTN